MEKRLLRLIYDYSVLDKKIDNSYIEKFVDIVVSEKKLNGYVSDIELHPDDDSYKGNKTALAVYNPLSKRIIIYTNGILELLYRNDKYRKLFTRVENAFYAKIQISQIVLHELEHANQRKKIDNEESLESQILRLSMADISIDKLKSLLDKGFTMEQLMLYIYYKGKIRTSNYKANYEKAPEERLADIKSHKEIISILENIKEYVPNLIDFEITNLLENMIRGYTDKGDYIEPPTIRYLLDNGNQVGLSKFDWYDDDAYKALKKSKDNYSLNDRLNFGLMIDEDEYYKSKQMLQYSKKYNCC